MTVMTFAAGAIADSIPAGPAFAVSLRTATTEEREQTTLSRLDTLRIVHLFGLGPFDTRDGRVLLAISEGAAMVDRDHFFGIGDLRHCRCGGVAATLACSCDRAGTPCFNVASLDDRIDTVRIVESSSKSSRQSTSHRGTSSRRFVLARQLGIRLRVSLLQLPRRWRPVPGVGCSLRTELATCRESPDHARWPWTPSKGASRSRSSHSAALSSQLLPQSFAIDRELLGLPADWMGIVGDDDVLHRREDHRIRMQRVDQKDLVLTSQRRSIHECSRWSRFEAP